jgi:hypothetical protein
MPLTDSSDDDDDSATTSTSKIGVYTDFYGLDYWKQSMGFYAVVGVFGIYSLGLVLSLVFDVQPHKRVKFRLLRDFTNINTQFQGTLYKQQQQQ